MKTQTLSERLNGYTKGFTKSTSEIAETKVNEAAMEVGAFFDKLASTVDKSIMAGLTSDQRLEAPRPGKIAVKIKNLGKELLKQMDFQDIKKFKLG